MGALAQGFKQLSDAMSEGRARLNLSDRLRGVTLVLRSDLENLTLRPDPLSGSTEGSGYFEYFDGMCSDYFMSTHNFDPTASDLNAILPTSRFGDVDDIIAFTVRSRGEPFRGKVPLAVVDPTSSDLTTMVSISSEYAEVVYFMQPKMFRDASGELVNATTFQPNIVSTSPSGFPDEYILFRRVLLIRPDLNIPLDESAPLHLNGIAVSGTSMIAMAPAFQLCDLSMRRIAGGQVAANSLKDLARRENRFAHFVLPTTDPILASTGLTSSSTVPLLALTNPVVGSVFTPSPNYSGFLHPSFVLSGDRTGEDMLLSNAVSFDIKGFDPAAPIYYHIANSAMPTASTSLGDVGTDHVTVGPSDPGFPIASQTTNSNNMSGDPTLVPKAPAGRGCFVDLGWGSKVIERAGQVGVGVTGSDLNTPLSLTSMTAFDKSFLQSGLCIATGTSPVIYQPCFDSWTDSYEQDGMIQGEIGSGFEGSFWINGLFDLGLSNSANDNIGRGPDRGSNGIDDIGRAFGSGGSPNGIIDDFGERELSPPVAFSLSAIQVIIRAEDKGTSVLHQMSVVQDFVSQ